MPAITKPPYMGCNSCIACEGEECSDYQFFSRYDILSHIPEDGEDGVAEGPQEAAEEVMDDHEWCNAFDEPEEPKKALPPPVDTDDKANFRAANLAKNQFIEEHYGVNVSKAPTVRYIDVSDDQRTALAIGSCLNCGRQTVKYTYQSSSKPVASVLHVCKNVACKQLLRVLQ